MQINKRFPTKEIKLFLLSFELSLLSDVERLSDSSKFCGKQILLRNNYFPKPSINEFDNKKTIFSKVQFNLHRKKHQLQLGLQEGAQNLSEMANTTFENYLQNLGIFQNVAENETFERSRNFS